MHRSELAIGATSLTGPVKNVRLLAVSRPLACCRSLALVSQLFRKGCAIRGLFCTGPVQKVGLVAHSFAKCVRSASLLPNRPRVRQEGTTE
jgi:hypothetical protein